MLDTEKRADSYAILITAPLETLNAVAQSASKSPTMHFEGGEFSSVTATCQGSFASPLPEEIARALSQKSVKVHKLLFSAMSITVIVDAKDREKAVQTVHDLNPA
jgi:aspartokinase